MSTGPTGTAPTPADLAERISTLPDVTCLLADEESGAPQIAWGDRFFSIGPQQRHMFATIVEHDTPGYDEDSRLDRPGVFRLNVDAGKDGFTRLFGYPPRELAAHRAGIDFSRLDEVMPHPAYGAQGWVCVLNPSAARLSDLDRLLTDAHHRAHERHRRALDRQRDS